MDQAPFYQAMTRLPREVEEKLLQFNILQLCALVSERNGAKWSGASDRYGPVKEISERWELEDLKRRIAMIQPEEPLATYAKIMTNIGGNPSRERLQDIKGAAKQDRDMRAKYDDHSKVQEKIASKLRPLEQDEVRIGLSTCTSMDDLKRVAKEQGFEGIDWDKIDGLANFGLKRMYLGNKWRTVIRHRAAGTEPVSHKKKT
jgi:hypothetical protein